MQQLLPGLAEAQGLIARCQHGRAPENDLSRVELGSRMDDSLDGFGRRHDHQLDVLARLFGQRDDAAEEQLFVVGKEPVFAQAAIAAVRAA